MIIIASLLPFFLIYLFQCLDLHAKFYDKNSELDAIRGLICFSRRPNYTVTGMILAK